MPICPSRYRAGLAIFLITAIASLGIAARFFVSGTTGQLLFILTRVLLLGLPLIWFRWVDQSRLVLSSPSKQQSLIGTTLGILMFGVILSAYWFGGQHWISAKTVQSKAAQIAITSPTIYLLGAFYFTIINSLIEEYVWRWFVGGKCAVIFTKTGAVTVSALCFTLHHIIALIAYLDNGLVILTASLGVFIAGAVWSWCYLTYRSIWVSYISHVLADLAIALIGWHLLFVL